MEAPEAPGQVRIGRRTLANSAWTRHRPTKIIIRAPSVHFTQSNAAQNGMGTKSGSRSVCMCAPAPRVPRFRFCSGLQAGACDLVKTSTKRQIVANIIPSPDATPHGATFVFPSSFHALRDHVARSAWQYVHTNFPLFHALLSDILVCTSPSEFTNALRPY